MESKEHLLTIDQQHLLKRTFKKQKRSLTKLRWLWCLTGLFGGHQYYLKSYKKGILMTAIFIFALAVGWFTWYLLLAINVFWWLHDVFYLKKWWNQTNQMIYQQVFATVNHTNSE